MMLAGPSPATRHIREDRLWELLMTFARFGATANGGVNRQAFSREDIAARAFLVAWAAERGYATFQDEIGNLFVRREGQDAGLPPILTGSHLDSQPTGGKFDGAYGVVAGLEVLEALEDAGVQTNRPIEVVAWSNEEGSRFSPGTMGSSVFAGTRELDAIRQATDGEGVVLRDALEETVRATPASFRPGAEARPHAYVEAHIEQGPVLEDGGIPIGVVTGIQGVRRITIDIRGEEAHAGTTPRVRRRDALMSCVSVLAALRALTEDSEDVLRFTVGRCDVRPGSVNTVPGHVFLMIDLRHPDDETLTRIGEQIEQAAMAAAAPCRAEVAFTSYVGSTIFEPGMVELIAGAAKRLGLDYVTMPSGAGHDAMHLARICPTGMIFVPCRAGISHNERESAEPRDLADGARVLGESLAVLARA